MKILLNDGSVAFISINHNRNTLLRAEPINGQTTVEVDYFGDENTNKHGIGVAYCHANDQYNKKIGVRTALARALKMAAIERPVRAQIWDRIINGPKKTAPQVLTIPQNLV